MSRSRGGNPERQQRRRALLRIDPHCSNCGLELEEGIGDRQANLVRDRLSCHGCRSIVRAAAVAYKQQHGHYIT